MTTIKFDKEKVSGIICGIGVNTINRFPVFMKESEGLTDAEYWYGLAAAYSDSDNLFKWRKLVKSAFTVDRPHREFLMNGREKRKLQHLPRRVQIFRGMTEEEYASGNFGISWTLNRKVADFFVGTYMRNFSTRHLKKRVHSLMIDKKNIIAVFNGREEEEVIFITKPPIASKKIIQNHIKQYKFINDPYAETKLWLPSFDPNTYGK